jgi:hypothetical protein
MLNRLILLMLTCFIILSCKKNEVSKPQEPTYTVSANAGIIFKDDFSSCDLSNTIGNAK